MKTRRRWAEHGPEETIRDFQQYLMHDFDNDAVSPETLCRSARL